MKRILAITLSLFLLIGCSRDGFNDSLNKRQIEDLPVDVSEGDSPSQSEDTLPVSSVFAMDIKEIAENNLFISYSVPSKNGVNDVAAEIIAKRIDMIIDEVKKSFDLSLEDAYLEIYDSVGVVDEDIVSLFYEGTFNNKKLDKPSTFAFGLTFSAKTGGQLIISDVMQPHTLASLLTDEQSSKVKAKEEEANKKREAISKMGMASLADRIVAADSQRDMDCLLTFSYYLEKGKLIAILPMEEVGEKPAYIEVFCDKV